MPPSRIWADRRRDPGTALWLDSGRIYRGHDAETDRPGLRHRQPCAPPASAHPHVFVDVGHILVFDAQGRLAAIRSVWSYDELFTLLMIEDGQYDSDGDGSISPSELDAMQMWDADWPADYGGDLEVEVGGRIVSLEAPTG